jgi:Raf kinase inhibitor-like YbhB/YbcL family protein
MAELIVAGQAGPGRLALESSVLKEGAEMPRQYTADGRNVSPPLSWRNVPSGTRQLVVSCQDDDEVVPLQVPFLHWVIYNIPPGARGLPEGIPAVDVLSAPADLVGAFQAYTSFSYPTYRGPQPPPGQLHRYRFIIRALDADLNLPQGLFANAVLKAIEGHVIAQSEILVTYTRARKD